MNPYYDTNVLYDAGDRAMNGSQFKYASKLYKLNQLLITAKLQKALQNGTYHPKGSMKFRYRERGKERLISSIVTPDKAVNHVICDEVLTPYLQKFLQYDNSASQKGKGVAFHRRRFENDLRNYYREEGTNEGYVLFIDFSGYYANIQHEPCKAVLHELLEKSGLSDELRIITEDLMDEIFKTFEMDVSRFSDEDIEAMMNGKVDPFMNMGVPKELLTGEKMLAKGADIGNQLAQNIGITFPYLIKKMTEYKNIKDGLLAIMHDRLYQMSTFFLKEGYINTSALKNLEYLYNSYHALGGNGTGTELYTRAKGLPIKED